MALIIWLVIGGLALAVWAAVLIGLLAGVTPTADTLRYFSDDFLQRAAQYERVRLTLYLLRQVVVTAFLVAAVLWAAPKFKAGAALTLPQAAGYIALFLLIFYFLTLPLDYYRGFVVEHRFGFSTQGPLAWLVDYGKANLISLVISTGVLTGLYFLIFRWPERWVLPAWLAISFFMIASSYLYPVLITPLFNRFSPIEDTVLKEEILAMAEKAGIGVDQVLVADASRRTLRVNAYFAGLGRTRQIVLYDNLLQRFPREEVLAVVAHEIGHWRHGHITRGVVLGIAGAFILLHIFGLFLKLIGPGVGFHLIPLALLFFTLASLSVLPLQNAFSRSIEREADLEALMLTADSAAFISLKQRLAESNLSVVQPHPLIRAVLYTHPPIMERIKMAEQVK